MCPARATWLATMACSPISVVSHVSVSHEETAAADPGGASLFGAPVDGCVLADDAPIPHFREALHRPVFQILRLPTQHRSLKYPDLPTQPQSPLEYGTSRNGTSVPHHHTRLDDDLGPDPHSRAQLTLRAHHGRGIDGGRINRHGMRRPPRRSPAVSRGSYEPRLPLRRHRALAWTPWRFERWPAPAPLSRAGRERSTRSERWTSRTWDRSRFSV